jgi:hypothetical protein
MHERNIAVFSRYCIDWMGKLLKILVKIISKFMFKNFYSYRLGGKTV